MHFVCFQGVADIFTRVVSEIEKDSDEQTKDKDKCVISWSGSWYVQLQKVACVTIIEKINLLIKDGV